MVNFVKRNLLGTKKEFSNRFINPITNGQCADSTQRDVRIMKNRSHVLHEMLDGCVQRKDYSCLSKFLPPKFEYVISVRLSSVQVELYQKYLDLNVTFDENGKRGGGATLFRDYQNLMRIWTHPWVLKMHQDRMDEKVCFC
jgi:transcriptional regulator ATRX